jgi:hypothetical protein
VSVAPTPLRRLTHAEYDHAVRALLGTALEPARDFPLDLPAAGFASNRGDPISLLGVEKLMLAAEALAAEAAARLETLVPCAPAQGDATCARQFFGDFARKAYRRTLSNEELEELAQLYAQGERDSGFAYGVQIVIERILQSPHFLYRIERTAGPPAGDVARLSGLSVADRLAAMIWHSIPDRELLDAAERGELDSAEGVAAQAERMLLDQRGTQGIVEFFNQWLDIEKLSTTEKDPAIYPAFSAEVRSGIWNETASFVNQIVRQGDARLETLFTSNLGLPSSALAPLYGVAPSEVLAPLDPLVRFGMLTHPSVLAVHAHADQSSPVKRGAFIRERVMCSPLPDPPPAVNDTPPVVSPDATTRERFELHRADPACASCHALIDPLGFAFERYDGMGVYRATEGSLPIDTGGDLIGSWDIDGPFQGAVDLAQRLASSDQVRDCMARQWLRYALRREEREETDACSLERLHQAFGESGDLRALISALVQSDAFRFKSLKGAP